jgi:CubicO group peptidase (beta-lactamase class C family)
MRTRLALVCCCILLVSCNGKTDIDDSAGSGPFDAVELSEIVESVRARYALPGLGVLVQAGNQDPLIAVSGIRKLGGDDRVRESDMWFIGSTAKAMTSALLASFVAEGAVSFESTLFELYPDVSESFSEAAKQITLAHVLSHSAGLLPNPADSPGDLARILGDTTDIVAQRKIILTKAVSGDLLFTPGSDYSYSNTGYIIAGAVIDRLGGKDYETLLAERVLNPLGVSYFGFGQPGASSPDHIIDQPWGHRPSLFRLLPVSPEDREHTNPALFNSAGNLYLSLENWAKFVHDQLAGQKGQGALFEQALYESLQMPANGETGYAKGWGVLVEKGSPVMLTHSGGDGNWYADVRAYPPTDLILLIVTNDGRDEDEAKAAVTDIRRRFNSRYSPAP